MLACVKNVRLRDLRAEANLTQNLLLVGPELFTYRVAQNKIPHETICNISATSGLISKILEAASS